MVRRVVVVAALLIAGCGSKAKPCKDGTALVAITVAAGVSADMLSMSVSIDGAAAKTQTFAGGSSGSVEIDFSTTPYTSGSTVDIIVLATKNGTTVARGAAAATLTSGCTAIAVAVGATDGDGGAGDPLGVVCTGGDTCGTGKCVDGRCCDSACTGSCEACDVAGSLGTCTAVAAGDKPRAAHTACTGDATGACAGSCDGTQRATCAYPTSTCGTTSCSGGVVTSGGTCGAGSCMTGSDTHACTFGCQAGTGGCVNVTQLAMGYYHACALLSNGTIKCWGNNDAGQAGNAVNTAYLKPTDLFGASQNPVMLSATFSSTCILDGTDHKVRCFGSNAYGEHGIGTTDTMIHSSPDNAGVNGISDATFIMGSSGSTHCAIVTGGGVKCWGGTSTGDGNAAVPHNAPITICAPGSVGAPCAPMTGATFVRGGDSHACAIIANGGVACWGDDSQGEAGSTPINGVLRINPATVAGVTGAVFLAAGAASSCAATGTQALCWGSGGKLGAGPTMTANTATPGPVCSSADCTMHLSGVTEVYTTDESACALAGGAITCWGGNSGGQFGDGTQAPQTYAATQAIGSGALHIATGGGFACAIVDVGFEHNVKCWGQGTLGNNTNMGSLTPVSPVWN